MDIEVGADGLIRCSNSDIFNFGKGVDIEVRANQFASELLLPKALSKEEVLNRELSWDKISDFADLCEVSLTAAARCFVDLTDEACALVVCSGTKVDWYHKSPSFNFFLETKSGVSKTTEAHSALSGSSPNEEFIEVPADAWLNSYNLSKKDTIQEWSRPLDSYGQVLTILWDDQGIGESINSHESRKDFDPNYGWETPTFHKSKRR